ncbi:uncharacterized protein METZ01_LOCUS105649 [marine metagenome]|uniref:Uncharacterized protein n=1 Tax=marine metagenome TaxID=408172 RepID=A0A381WLM3_9ZZZZ
MQKCNNMLLNIFLPTIIHNQQGSLFYSGTDFA